MNLYQQAIGCLTYISTATRPDISTTVSMLSSYMSNLVRNIGRESNLQQVKMLKRIRMETNCIANQIPTGQAILIQDVQHRVMYLK